MSDTNTVNFSIPEKMALVKMIYSVIIADRVVHKKEIQLMTKLTNRLNFDTSFIEQAQTLGTEESFEILSNLNSNKKQMVAKVLREVANADGFIHDREMALLIDIFNTVGISS